MRVKRFKHGVISKLLCMCCVCVLFYIRNTFIEWISFRWIPCFCLQTHLGTIEWNRRYESNTINRRSMYGYGYECINDPSRHRSNLKKLNQIKNIWNLYCDHKEGNAATIGMLFSFMQCNFQYSCVIHSVVGLVYKD